MPRSVALLIVVLPLVAQIACGQDLPLSFNNDVMPVLSKAGCNWGACHANTNGKGGLKLSLRGEDSAFDYAAIVRQHAERRVDTLAPEASLILAKATGRVAHQGGVRFKRSSLEYETLRRWIAAGAPGPRSDEPRLVALQVTPREQVISQPQTSLQLQALATFSDGSQRDVTRQAVYELTNNVVAVSAAGEVQRLSQGETTVVVRFLQLQRPVRLAFIPKRSNFAWSAAPGRNFIDDHVDAKLRQLRVLPSAMCDDSLFIRRASLDLLGLLPTADEAKTFVADPALDKRSQLVDALLQRPEFAEHFALKWSDLLRNEEKVLDPKGVDAFYGWIRDSLARGKPIDQFVREILSARGSTYAIPPANFYRAVRDANTRGETVARLFLGVRLQCARCHNHPFDRWTQDNYYSWSAVFSRIDYQVLENKKGDKFDQNAFDGEQIVVIKQDGDFKNVRTGKIAEPQFLGSGKPVDSQADRLHAVADWAASAENDLFVKSQVNFVWYQLMARGLVEPLDDFRLTNPASNPPLLDALAADFVRSGFELRRLIRTIMASRAYQASYLPSDTNGEDENFSRAIVRRLPAETLLDIQCQALDAPLKFQGYPAGTRAGQVRGVRRGGEPTAAERFLKTFGKSDRILACECERSNETTLKQSLVLIGDDGLNQRLSQDHNRLNRWLQADLPTPAIIDELYWTMLSRPPTESERSLALAELAKVEDLAIGLQDLAWAVMNSKEFVFRH